MLTLTMNWEARLLFQKQPKCQCQCMYTNFYYLSYEVHVCVQNYKYLMETYFCQQNIETAQKSKIF